MPNSTKTGLTDEATMTIIHAEICAVLSSDAPPLQKFRTVLVKYKTALWAHMKSGMSKPDCSDIVNNMIQVFEKLALELNKIIIDLEIVNHTTADPYKMASAVIFPVSQRGPISYFVRPLFLAHFALWRRDDMRHRPNLETKALIKAGLKKGITSAESNHMYMLQSFFSTYRSGVFNMETHLEWNLASQIRQLATSYVVNEFEVCHAIRHVWFQEVVAMLRRWANILSLPRAFESTEITLHCDLIDSMTSRIYELVVNDFPENFKTLFTLRYCMRHANEHGRERLGDVLIRGVEKNLLLAAVDTKTILKGYASCVDSLRNLDSTCVVMHRVCGVIKDYLKKRPDTIQQIIGYITSDKKSQMQMGLTNRSAMMDDDELKGVNDDFLPENMDSSNWNLWKPDPVDMLSGESSQFRQGVDVFNMLVSVYGSKELFVKEYRTLLAERLSNSNSRDASFEKRYLELLKLRFQYNELQHCEVMLRDVEHSQKIDSHASTKTYVPMSACIVSSHYWPKFEYDKNSTPLPEALEKSLKRYESVYSKVCGSRKLKWLRGVGCVDVKIEIDEVVVEMNVPNIYASVLYLFLENERWSATDVSEKIGVMPTVAKRRLEWWVKQGLLVQTVASGATCEEWSLTQNSQMLANHKNRTPEYFDEDETEIEDSNDMVESLEQYWGYTKNYIEVEVGTFQANHAPNGEVKAERMHRMYRMFGSPTSAGPTLEHVNTFLQRKVQLGLLAFFNGVYRVVKDV